MPTTKRGATVTMDATRDRIRLRRSEIRQIPVMKFPPVVTIEAPSLKAQRKDQDKAPTQPHCRVQGKLCRRNPWPEQSPRAASEPPVPGMFPETAEGMPRPDIERNF